MRLLHAAALVVGLFVVGGASAAESKDSARQVFGLMWAGPVSPVAVDVPDLLSPRWKKREFSTPLFHPASGTIFIGSDDGVMRALTLDRELLWQLDVQAPIRSVPVVGEHWLYFGADDANLYAVDPSTGKKGWALQADAEITGSVVLSGDRLYFTTALDSLYCLAAETGDYLWHAKRAQPLSITIAGNADPALGSVPDGKGQLREVVSQACADGTVALLEAETGRELWRAQVGQGEAFFDVDADPIVSAKRVVVAAYSGGVSALDPVTGQVQWHQAIDGLSQLSRQGEVVVGAGDRQVVGLDWSTGALLWRLQLRQGLAGKPIVTPQYALVNVDAGPLYVLDLISGEPLQVFGSALGMCGRPDLHDDLLLLHSKSGWLYALSAQFSGWAQAARD